MKKIIIPIITTILLSTSCNQDYLDPTQPSQDLVLGSREGIIGAANGLQQIWTIEQQSPIYTTVTATGFTTKELRLINAGNVPEGELLTGGEVVSTNNTIVNNIWSRCLVVKSEAEKIINNSNVLTDENEKNSIIVHATIFKALAITTIIQYFERATLITQKSATFNSRTEVLKEAIKILTETEPYLEKATGFEGLVKGIDYKNTVYALLARTYLMSEDYDNAILYAKKVNLEVKSVFPFDEISANPIYLYSISTNNVFQPINRSLGLPTSLAPETTDGRLDFYTENSDPTKAVGFFSSKNKSIPVYLPGEMMLIIAEGYARKDDITQAITELNKVLTKTAQTDVFGIGANLTVYSGATTKEDVLTEIYKNRCIEMYMSGLKLEDSRRFKRPAAGTANAERNRNWYPYPDSERNNNPNTPHDPEI